jgi:hypothetical protein
MVSSALQYSPVLHLSCDSRQAVCVVGCVLLQALLLASMQRMVLGPQVAAYCCVPFTELACCRCCCCCWWWCVFRLARYNEPWQPLPFRRNEVLIDLQDFKLI